MALQLARHIIGRYIMGHWSIWGDLGPVRRFIGDGVGCCLTVVVQPRRIQNSQTQHIIGKRVTYLLIVRSYSLSTVNVLTEGDLPVRVHTAVGGFHRYL